MELWYHVLSKSSDEYDESIICQSCQRFFFVQVRSPSLGKAMGKPLGLIFRCSLQPSRWITSIGSRWSNLGWNSVESTEFCVRIFQTKTVSFCRNCDSKFFLDCTCMTPGSLESRKRWWCWKSAVHQFFAGLQVATCQHSTHQAPFRSGSINHRIPWGLVWSIVGVRDLQTWDMDMARNKPLWYVPVVQ